MRMTGTLRLHLCTMFLLNYVLIDVKEKTNEHPVTEL